MKQCNFSKLFFCFFMMIYILNVQAFDTKNYKPIYFSICNLLDCVTKIKKNDPDSLGDNNDLAHWQDQDDDESQDTNNIDKILVVLIGTYQKIVTATVTHYVMLHATIEYDLHGTIASILIEDFTKIIKIAGNQLMKLAVNPQVSLKKKVLYSMSVISAILALKMLISHIPTLQK